MKQIILIVSLLVATLSPLAARSYFVSSEGCDRSGSGTKESPLRTIAKAVGRMEAGDRCIIRGGTYHEEVALSLLEGEREAPIVIEAYAGERVVLSGAVSLNDLKWSRYRDGIYSAPLKQCVTQLFVDGRSMCAARHPNGNWYDGSIWDKTKSMLWPESGEMGRYENHEIAELGYSIEGCWLVVNSGSFKTYLSRITHHRAAEASFRYDKSSVKGHFTTEDAVHRHGYFLEGSRDLIDTEGEWFYDTKERRIYLYAPEGRSPSGFNVEGKQQSYFFSGKESRHIVIRGVEFFGTTVKFENSFDVTIEDCTFRYPSYNRRMEGCGEWPEVTSFVASDMEREVNYRLINCDFSFGDGPAIKMRGRNCLVENCSFNDFDFSCITAGGFMFDLAATTNLRFRRNTAWNTGNSEMLQVGRRAIVELNDLSRCGFLQNDGAVIQVSVAGQDRTIIRYNWVHDAVKQGIRFDNSNTPNAPWGENGTVHHNVVWNTERLFIKGDNHFIFNNTIFDSAKNDLIISANKKINGRNFSTMTHNNLAGEISGDINRPNSEVAAPGTLSHNFVSGEQSVTTLLRDAASRDFRPRAESPLLDAGAPITTHCVEYLGASPDIGAYEYGCTEYWIAGRRVSKPSSEIPMDGSVASVDCDLIWLGEYKATEYRVYFGESREDLRLVATQKNNIFTPNNLVRDKRYFWRINDGDTWSFTTK